MTISTTTNSVIYLGNGSTTVFSFSFVGASSSDISVVYTNASGTQTVLNPSLYTLVLNSPSVGQLWGVGGTVTYPTVASGGLAIPGGTSLEIIRTLPLTQDVSISNQGAFYPQVIEQGLDVLEMQIQQISTDYEYTLKTPTSDPNPPNTLPSYLQRANGYLAFDASGQPIIVENINVPVVPGSASPRKVSVNGVATINILTTDAFGGLEILQTGTGLIQIQLPASGGPFPIFDASGTAGTSNIKILAHSGQTILGQSSFTMAYNFQSVTCYLDGVTIVTIG